MVKVKYKEVKISEVFSYKRGNSKYTRKYCNNNKGDYEVFTGTTIGSFGFINTYDYDGELLTYTTDGEYAGTLKLLKGKFNVGGHRAILLPLSEQLNLDYFVYILQNVLYSRVKKGDVPSLSWKEIKDCKINIPINKQEEYDLEQQEKIVMQYEMIESRKSEIQEKLDFINDVEVVFPEDTINESISIEFEKLFEIERGQVISRAYINKNQGEFPVYSTQLDEPFGYIDSYMYEGQYLIWNTDGLGGYIRLVDNKFSVTNIVGIMKVRKEYEDKIELEYVRRFLQPIFRENTKGREGIDGKNEYTKINSTMIKSLNIKVDFPITDDGDIDLKKQKEIIRRYELVDEMKRNVSEKGIPFTLVDMKIDNGEVKVQY